MTVVPALISADAPTGDAAAAQADGPVPPLRTYHITVVWPPGTGSFPGHCMDGGRSASGTAAVSPAAVLAAGTPRNRYGTAPMPGWTT